MDQPVNPDFEVEEHSFINFFNSYMQNQEVRHAETQENFVRMLNMLNSNAQSRDSGAPRNGIPHRITLKFNRKFLV